MSSSSSPTLFQPTKIGNITLGHRVVLAPLTRFKSGRHDHVPMVHLMKEYYSQRSSMPGSLLITEGALIAAKAVSSYNSVPGIWSAEQILAWKEITAAVHAKGSYIFIQLWAPGRAVYVSALEAGVELVAPSPIPIASQSSVIPKPLTTSEIKEYVEFFAQGARNAIEAGFDGVEIHGANGYLIDQFFQDVSNKRTDDYGGSVENRNRFALEITDAVVQAVGPERTAFRLSPWSPFQDMRMDDPIPQFTHFVTALKLKYPTLAYLHLVEPRIDGDADTEGNSNHESNNFIRAIWEPLPLMVAGGYTRESALKAAEEKGDLVAFGRFYISNPDLPARLKYNIPLTPYDRKTFYIPGYMEGTEVGYIDYPFAKETEKL